METAYAKYLKEVTQAVTVSFLAWTLGILVMWGITSYRKNELAQIPESVVTMVGISTSGTLLNRFLDIKNKLNDTKPNE